MLEARDSEDQHELTRAREHPRGEHHDASHETQHTLDRDTDQAEWNEEEPDDRVEHQRQQRERPADNQQQAPQQELHHTEQYEIGVARFGGCHQRMLAIYPRKSIICAEPALELSDVCSRG